MLVETYEVEEARNEAETLAADSEAIELINSLELAGQKTLTNPDTVTRFPYRKMTEDEARVYGILCPQRCKIESYAEGIIPLRVLQVAAHIKQIGFCNYVEVWHAVNADIKDPVLVGVKGSEYNGERYMLARWGAELPSFEELRTMAVRLWRIKRKTALSKIANEVQAALATNDQDESLADMPGFYMA